MLREVGQCSPPNEAQSLLFMTNRLQNPLDGSEIEFIYDINYHPNHFQKY